MILKDLYGVEVDTTTGSDGIQMFTFAGLLCCGVCSVNMLCCELYISCCFVYVDVVCCVCCVMCCEYVVLCCVLCYVCCVVRYVGVE